MYRDVRGGHNRNKINEDFFKTWSFKMAYVLGFIFADGAIEDVRNSSRTCYIQISNNDKLLLEQIRKTMSSNHKIYRRCERLSDFLGKEYVCSESFHLRIGNKIMFQDLINLGVTPRKSLTMNLPNIPQNYFGPFLRGYFDGDGCISVYKGGNKSIIVQIIFVSGSFNFLHNLSRVLSNLIGVSCIKVSKNSHSFKICYKKRDSLRILHLMYKGLNTAPFLERKYKKYQDYLLSLQLLKA